MRRKPKTIRYCVDPEFYEYSEQVRKKYQKSGVQITQRDISRMLVRQIKSMRKTYGLNKTKNKR